MREVGASGYTKAVGRSCRLLCLARVEVDVAVRGKEGRGDVVRGSGWAECALAGGGGALAWLPRPRSPAVRVPEDDAGDDGQEAVCARRAGQGQRSPEQVARRLKTDRKATAGGGVSLSLFPGRTPATISSRRQHQWAAAEADARCCREPNADGALSPHQRQVRDSQRERTGQTRRSLHLGLDEPLDLVKVDELVAALGSPVVGRLDDAPVDEEWVELHPRPTNLPRVGAQDVAAVHLELGEHLVERDAEVELICGRPGGREGGGVRRAGDQRRRQ